MFTLNTADLDYLFESAGQPVLINDIERQAIITNPSLSEYEERYLQTLDKVLQGDLVSIDNEKYLIVSETVSKRNGKYKSIIRHCNYVIEIAGESYEDYLRDGNGNIIYDDWGEPITTTVQGDPYFISAIVENKSFAISGTQLLVADNQIIVLIQDNELNRDKFAVNNTFSVMGKKWKVLNDNRTKRGLLILTCEMTA